MAYNRVNKIPNFQGEPRPEFLVSRDYTPLKPVSEKALI